MKIAILNQQKHLRIRAKLLEKLVELVLEKEPKDTEVSIRFVDDKVIAKLNEKYLHHSGPTDVISFPMRTGNFSQLHTELLGDVVISTQQAIVGAKRFGTGVGEELCLYVLHGILHLLGHDDNAPASRRRMEKRQAELLSTAAEYFGKDFFERVAQEISVERKEQSAK